MALIARNPLNPFQSIRVILAENPGKADMTNTAKDGEKLQRCTSASKMKKGDGVKAGRGYRMPDGNLVYVPG
jgi:hypothetical protein